MKTTIRQNLLAAPLAGTLGAATAHAQTDSGYYHPRLRTLTELLEVMEVTPAETGGTITIAGRDPFIASPDRTTTTTA